MMKYKKSKPKRYVKQPGTRFPGKGLLLFILPLGTVVATIKAMISGHFMAIIINGGGAALFLLGALLMRKGLAVEAEYHSKKITLAPKPYKNISALIIAFSTGVIAHLGAAYSLPVAILFALGALLGMYLSYGFDPRLEKTTQGQHGYSTKQILATISEANALINQIETAAREIDDHELSNSLMNICSTARAVVRGLEEDPGDIRRARKFLHVYLDSTRKVTEGYAKTHKRLESKELESDFRHALETIETEFQRQQQQLLDNEVLDLDVQIEVLTKQLKRDGVL